MLSFNESSIGQDVVELVVDVVDPAVLEQSLVPLNVVLQKLMDTKNLRLKDIKIFYWDLLTHTMLHKFTVLRHYCIKPYKAYCRKILKNQLLRN